MSKDAAVILKAALMDFTRKFQLDERQPRGKEENLRNRLGAFLQVSSNSASRWFSESDATEPAGENAVRVMELLTWIGYRLVEMEDLSEAARDLHRCIAIRAFTAQEYSDFLKVPTDVTYAYATGRRGWGDERRDLTAEFIRDKAEQVKTASLVWESALADLFPQVAAERAGKDSGQPESDLSSGTEVIALQPTTVQSSTLSHDQIIKTLVHLILAAKPLAALLESDEFTSGEREEFRQLAVVGRSDGVFDLANSLCRLGSERARNLEPSSRK